MELEEEIENAIRSQVRRYKARCWWADEADLRQTAVRVALEALRTWDPARGPRMPYVRTALVKGLWRALLRESAPVSATDHHLRELKGLKRAPVEKAFLHVDPRPWADELLADKGWRERVGKALRASAEVVPDGFLGLSVLLGADARAVARSNRVPTARVREAVAQLEARVRLNAVARAALRQRC